MLCSEDEIECVGIRSTQGSMEWFVTEIAPLCVTLCFFEANQSPTT